MTASASIAIVRMFIVRPSAEVDDLPIPYIERTRGYYRALGYLEPYRWATFDEVPLHRLTMPLTAARVAIITTAAPYQPGKGDQRATAPTNAAAKFYTVYSADSASDPDLRISHVAIDRDHTSGDDIGSYFPLRALRQAAAAGSIGSVAARFHGLPTNRSQRATLDVDVAEIIARCRQDRVDAVVLAANCPICHQSVSLAARRLEAAGIATVVMGCALDIVEHVGVPRYLFSDFPLGNAAGRPHDKASQKLTLALALDLLAAATSPRTTNRSPLRWNGKSGWKNDYANASRLTAEELQRRRAEFDRGRETARSLRADCP